jgi:5S rRNA maturation endonuclease (ribonuclease M5)
MDQKLRKAISNFDLEEYVHQTFTPVIVGSGGSELRINCFAPRGCRGSDNKQHLWINPEKKVWICYKCGYGNPVEQRGTAFLPRFVADAEGVPINQIIERFTGQVQTTPSEELEELLQDLFDKQARKVGQQVVEPLQLPASFTVPVTLDYLRSRGVDSRMIHEHDIRYCSSVGLRKWYRRVVFPIRDLDGTIVSAVGRTVVPGLEPRWMNWPNTDLQRMLWPLGRFSFQEWAPLQGPLERVLVVEGVMDALGAEKASGYVALATFGHKLSSRQVEVLQGLQPDEVTLAWDYDARSSMLQAVRKLQGRFRKVSVFPFRNLWWKTHDFGDLLTSGKMADVFIEEVQHNRINVDSNEFIAWSSACRVS